LKTLPGGRAKCKKSVIDFPTPEREKSTSQATAASTRGCRGSLGEPRRDLLEVGEETRERQQLAWRALVETAGRKNNAMFPFKARMQRPAIHKDEGGHDTPGERGTSRLRVEKADRSSLKGVIRRDRKEKGHFPARRRGGVNWMGGGVGRG